MGCQGKAVIKAAPTWCWSSVRSSSAVMSPEPEPAACWERSVKTHKGRQRRHAENGTGNTQEKAVKTHKGGQRKTQGKEAKRQGRAGPHTREGSGNAQGRAVETHTHVETHKERQRRHRERHAESTTSVVRREPMKCSLTAGSATAIMSVSCGAMHPGRKGQEAKR